MSAELLHGLLKLSVAMSAGILIVATLRKPVRYLAGARAAYCLWVLIPVGMLAVSAPAPEVAPAFVATRFVPALISQLHLSAAVPDTSVRIAPWALALWLLGSVLMIALAIKRQRDFVSSMGHLSTGTDGMQRSRSISSPMLVGIWRPRIVLPVNFEDQYDAEERALVLAHEDAHCRRGDAPVNALATLGVCAFWPNPLMHWAISRFRFDQELACDALVLSGIESHRRRYADALLKAQLATESRYQTPAACHWQSAHPLKERVAMLKKPLPGRFRRAAGIATILTMVSLTGYTVWAVQPGETKEKPAASETAHFSFYADEVIKADDGALMISGHVTFKPLPSSPPPKMSAERIRTDPRGATVFDGTVVIKFGDRTVTTDRAVRMPDGTLRMDAARTLDLFIDR